MSPTKGTPVIISLCAATGIVSVICFFVGSKGFGWVTLGLCLVFAAWSFRVQAEAMTPKHALIAYALGIALAAVGALACGIGAVKLWREDD